VLDVAFQIRQGEMSEPITYAELASKLGIEIGERQNREDKIAKVKNFLNDNRIGITDIVTSCQRENIKSPSDKDLLNVIINKELIHNLTTTNQSKRLIFTSGDWEIGVNNPNFHQRLLCK
jgi:hypothetical protein